MSNNSVGAGKVLASDLARVINDAAIFASRDTTFPMLNAVQLESSGKHLVAVATDRFTMGCSVADYVDGDGPVFTGALKLQQAQLVAKVANSAKAAFAEVEVNVTDESMSFTFTTGESLTLPKVAGDIEFPDWRKIMESCHGEPGSTESIAINPQYVARFGRVSDSRRIVFTFRGPTKAALVSVGSQFVGLIMPVRLDEADAEPQTPDWLKRPEPSKPAPKKRAARSKPKAA